MPPELIDVPLKKVLTLSPTTRTLRLDWSLEFVPGQAIQVSIPGDEKRRFYSISSSPTEKSAIDITIKAPAGSPLAQQLDRLETGTDLKVAGPFGAFKLPPNLEQPLCFIAAGSGITPFRSMIKFLLDGGRAPEMWVFYSAASREDLIFGEELSAWAKMDDRVRYIPTITRETPADWSSETGRISESMMRKHVQVEQCCFLLCGPPTFVSDMERLLIGMSIPPERIRREQW